MDKMAWKIPGKKNQSREEEPNDNDSGPDGGETLADFNPLPRHRSTQKEKGKPVCYSAHSAGFRRTLVIC